MDTGAVRSCMNYDTYKELGDTTLNWKATPTVTGGRWQWPWSNGNNEIHADIRKQEDRTRIHNLQTTKNET